MDIIAMLKPEHNDVTGILEKLEANTEHAVKSRENFFSTVYHPLSTHTDFDQEYFPPLVR